MRYTKLYLMTALKLSDSNDAAAKPLFKEAIRLMNLHENNEGKQYEQCLIDLAMYYRRHGMNEQAKSVLQKVLVKGGQNDPFIYINACLDLSSILREEKQFEASKQVAKKGFDMCMTMEKSTVSYRFLIQCFQSIVTTMDSQKKFQDSMKEIDRMLDYFNSGLPLASDELLSTYIMKAECFEKMGKVDAAHACFKKASELSDEFAVGYDARISAKIALLRFLQVHKKDSELAAIIMSLQDIPDHFVLVQSGNFNSALSASLSYSAKNNSRSYSELTKYLKRLAENAMSSVPPELKAARILSQIFHDCGELKISEKLNERIKKASS